MKKIIPFITMISFICLSAASQVNRPEIIKKKTVPVQTKITPVETPPPAPSVYSLASAWITVKTGNDNKESPSTFLLYITENKGAWGEGRELFAQQNQYPTAELKINSSNDIPLQKFQTVAPDAFTLANLQYKGLRFMINYYPNFFADAWKIETVTLTLEFKDQDGALHPTMGTKTIQFNISNGLLTNAKKIMTGTTDGLFTPQSVTITEK
jgi:hypothetical protein